MDFAVAKAMSLNNAYVRSLQRKELLDGVVAWDAIDLTSDDKSNRKGEAQWMLPRAETVYGFAVWWTVDLGSGVTLSTAPGAPKTHWEQLYFPLSAPISAKAGELIQASFKSRSSEVAGTHLAWSAAHVDAHGRRLSKQLMDLDKGYLP
jgi:protein arginine N-methyltransferase 1